LCFAILLPFYWLAAPEKQSLLAREFAEPATAVDIALLLAAAWLLAYWLACLIEVLRFRRGLRAQFSSLHRRQLSWLKWILAINILLWLCWVAGFTTQATWTEWLDTLAMPAGLYLLAFLGLRQPLIAEPETSAVVAAPALPLVAASSLRYQRSGLSAAEVPVLLSRLATLMQTEKPWLENDLSLAQLATRLGVSTHHLSQLLNEHLRQSFFEFVNRPRVEEVQRCLTDSAYSGQGILEIALAAGFNSKATFNQTFREIAGMTPSDWRRKAAATG
jgi:AraC-like DNA-binding protein